jgi:selenocysteine lyase/cysteine desulfurase
MVVNMKTKSIKNSYFLNWPSDVLTNEESKRDQVYWFEQQLNFAFTPTISKKNFREAVDEVRKSISRMLHTPSPNNFIFTTGSMNSIQMLMLSYSKTRNDDTILFPGDEIVVSDCEFPMIYGYLAARFRLKIVHIRKCKSQIEMIEAFKGSVSENTKLVFLSHVTYNSGKLLPVEQIITTIKSNYRKVRVILDGSQALGQVNINLGNTQSDFYIGDFHKWLQGPNNVGFLYCHEPYLIPQFNFIATNPFAANGVYGMEKYCCSKSGVVAHAIAASKSLLQEWVKNEHQEYLGGNNRKLSGIFLKKVSKIPYLSDNLMSPTNDKIRTGIVTFDFQEQTELIFQKLIENNIFCTLNQPFVPEHLRSQISTNTSIRLAFSDRWNTEEEVNAVFKILLKIVTNLKEEQVA